MKRARLSAALAFAALTLRGFRTSAFAAGPDPAAEAQRLVARLDVPETRAISADPLAKAKAAQTRAQSARGAGDLRHATELDALALTWAQVADDLVRTAAAEKTLSDVQKQVSDLEQKAVRTQALIEQTLARRGRAEQNLSNAEASSKASTNRATVSKQAAPKAAVVPSTPKPSKAGGGK